MSNGDGKKFIGAHTSEEFHRLLKVRCIEEGLTIREAIILGLALLLGIDVPDEYNEFYRENGYPTILEERR